MSRAHATSAANLQRGGKEAPRGRCSTVRVPAGEHKCRSQGAPRGQVGQCQAGPPDHFGRAHAPPTWCSPSTPAPPTGSTNKAPAKHLLPGPRSVCQVCQALNAQVQAPRTGTCVTGPRVTLTSRAAPLHEDGLVSSVSRLLGSLHWTFLKGTEQFYPRDEAGDARRPGNSGPGKQATCASPRAKKRSARRGKDFPGRALRLRGGRGMQRGRNTKAHPIQNTQHQKARTEGRQKA